METLVQQEFQDPLLDDLVRRCPGIAGFTRDQSIRAIADIAIVRERHRPHWAVFLTAHGIAMKPRRGPTAQSVFQPFCRFLLGHGDDGMATQWAAVLDAWEKTGIAADQIPAWIAGTKGGMRAIYEGCSLGSEFARIMARMRNGIHNDDVYTSRALARRIVDHFRPHFRPGDTFLDPCRGDGAFFDCLLEPRNWCEIAEGRDFLEWRQPVTWAITNTPWSAEVYRPIARHAYAMADNVVFLLRWHTATSTYARHRDWLAAGHGWRETIFINWDDAGFIDKHGKEKSEGFLLGAFWWQRGWTGGMTSTYWTHEIGIEAMREAAD